MTNVVLEDSDGTPIRHNWHKNYGYVMAMIVSNLNIAIVVVESMKVEAKITTKRARDEEGTSNKEDSNIKVLGVSRKRP